MNDLENEAKPILTPLIQGTARPLTPEDQNTLGRWASLVAAMACLLKPKLSVLPSYYRRFYETKSPPAATVVWLGKHEMRHHSEIYHRQANSYDWSAAPSLLAPVAVGAENMNGYSVTFAACYAAFKIVVILPPRDRTVRMDIKPNPDHPGLAPCWPPPRGPVSWPPGPALDDLAMMAVGLGRVTIDVAPLE
jgi:hypothetical protein